MTITIHYLAQLKRFTKVAEETIDVEDGCTLAALLVSLADRHGEEFRAGALDEQERPRPSLLFFFGDEQVRGDSARPLREGDVLTLLTPMAGG